MEREYLLVPSKNKFFDSTKNREPHAVLCFLCYSEHVVELQQPQILPGDLQLLRKCAVGGERFLGQQHLRRDRHHRTGGEPRPERPFPLRVQIRREHLTARLFHRRLGVRERQRRHGVVVLHVTVIGVLAVAVIPVANCF